MLSWEKTSAGYRLGGHTLTRSGRVWKLTLADGSEHVLGRRASFDHAEAVIASL